MTGLCAFVRRADVDQQRIVDAAASGENWLSYSRTYDEQRFSPLTQIARDNIGDLGLAWYAHFRDSARPAIHAARFIGLVFGVFVVSWLFSGLLSLSVVPGIVETPYTPARIAAGARSVQGEGPRQPRRGVTAAMVRATADSVTAEFRSTSLRRRWTTSIDSSMRCSPRRGRSNDCPMRS